MKPAIPSLIDAAERGDQSAAAALFSALYAELHRLARRELHRHADGATLGATTLLHEAYLDMAGRVGASFPDRGRFMAYACRVMRGLIIDHARHRRSARRGGLFQLTSLDNEMPAPASDGDLERMGEVLESLERLDPQLAEVVDLKFFCGFSFGEIASMRGISERTVQRRWDRARIYLHRALGTAPEG